MASAAPYTGAILPRTPGSPVDVDGVVADGRERQVPCSPTLRMADPDESQLGRACEQSVVEAEQLTLQ